MSSRAAFPTRLPAPSVARNTRFPIWPITPDWVVERPMFPENHKSVLLFRFNVPLPAVPPEARRILEVGCGLDILGAALKQCRPDRTVFGIELQPAVAASAAERLDRVFCLDVARDDPPLELHSLDCLLFGDALEHLVDPEAVLRRYRASGSRWRGVTPSIPNLQHHTLLAAWACSPVISVRARRAAGLHPPAFFTGSTILKLFLDAGYEPGLLDAIRLALFPRSG